MAANSIDINWRIPSAFYFRVEIGTNDIAFKEATGLSTEMEVETIQEGGVNEYEHRLPKQVKHGNLVLKRALMPISNNEIVKWISQVLQEGSFFNVEGRTLPLTRTIMVTLLNLENEQKNDSDGNPIYKWECRNAFPVKWEVEALDAEKNSVLIESVEFAYSTLKRME